MPPGGAPSDSLVDVNGSHDEDHVGEDGGSEGDDRPEVGDHREQ